MKFTLKSIVDRYSWKTVRNQLMQMKISKLEILRLYDVWKELRSLEVSGDVEAVEICMDIDGYYEVGSMHVYGKTDGEDEIDLSFSEWSDWLSYEVNEELKYFIGEIELLIHCMVEMKEWGNSNELVQKNIHRKKELKGVEESRRMKSNVVYLV